MIELYVTSDNIISDEVTSKEGNTFSVYAIDLGGYKVDVTIPRELLVDFTNGITYGTNVIVFKMATRSFEYNGRRITVPHATYKYFHKISSEL